MNLHRTSGKPDWETVPADKRTVIQNIAHATHGWLTPPNVISFIGFGLVLYGLSVLIDGQYWVAFFALLAGRLLDIVDGWVAESTGTKSPLGEKVDAVIDKIGTVLTIVVFFGAMVAEWWLIALLLVPQVIIPLVVFYKKAQGIHVHPSRAGKLSMAGLWGGLTGLLIVRALEASWPSPIVLVVDGVIFASVVLGVYALWQYATDRN